MSFIGGRRRVDLSIARQLLVLQVLLVLAVGGLAVGFAINDARGNARADAAHTVTAVATTFATTPSLIAALGTAQPSRVIEPMAEAVRASAGVDFVTVMSMNRIRYSHPDPSQIGKPFIGDVGGAPQGQVFTEEYAGTLGPSMRTVAPIRDAHGRVIAMVAVGIRVSAIDRQVARSLVPIALTAAGVLLLGLGGSWLVSRRVQRQTHGMGPRDVARMYEFYAAVLGAMREGLVLLDERGCVQLVNDEARSLLHLPEDIVGRHFGSLGLAPGLVAAALGRTPRTDDLFVAGERLVLVNSAPATWDDRSVGAVVTLRDQTELRAATGELEVVRGLTDSLRALNHESSNRLHAIVSLIELERYADALDFATDELRLSQTLTDQFAAVAADPAIAALLVGKSAEAAERGIELSVSGELPTLTGVTARDLVTVIGNLLDNAFDALAAGQSRRVDIHFEDTAEGASIVVGDSGPGLDQEQREQALTRGWSTKAEVGRGLGLALVSDVARRHAGSVTIGRSGLGGAEFRVTLRPGGAR